LFYIFKTKTKIKPLKLLNFNGEQLQFLPEWKYGIVKGETLNRGVGQSPAIGKSCGRCPPLTTCSTNLEK
jgi:hypothetical protein